MRSKRHKGRILEKLVQSVINDLGLDLYEEYLNPNANRKGEKYVDHQNKFCQIEDKYWSCKRKNYVIDVYRTYTQIVNRFDYHTPLKILIIADPVWSQNAKCLLNSYGINVISLEMDNIDSNYSKAYHIIKNKIIELYCLLSDEYGNIVPRHMCKDRKLDGIEERFVVQEGRYKGLPRWRMRQMLYEPHFISIMAEDKKIERYLKQFNENIF